MDNRTMTTSKKKEWYRSIASVFIVAICIFSTQTIAQNNVNAPKNQVMDNDGMITYRVGVSQELLTEYQAIVNKYLENPLTGYPNGNAKIYWK